jgi:DNA-directed RNA polymerase subunit H
VAKAKIEHILVPKHSKLSEKDKKTLLEKYHVNPKDLPKILVKDPAIANLGLKSGDIVKVERDSPTAGKSVFYRLAITESEKEMIAIAKEKEEEKEETPPEEAIEKELEEELPE